MKHSEGYTVILNYDQANRRTLETFPDGTTNQWLYDRLDAVMVKDRIGRWTTTAFDVLEQPSFQMDPLGRKTMYSWCACGSLGSLQDPAGHVTTWEHDLQGRLTRKTYADQTYIDYAYESNDSRLKTRKNARNQTATYSYNLDNSLSQVAYSDSSTSTVNLTYDPIYPRRTSVQNGWGTVSYAYNPYIQDPYSVGNVWLSGKPTTSDTVTLTFNNSSIPGNPYSLPYTVAATDTNLVKLSNSLVAAINANSTLSGVGITAKTNAPAIRTAAIGGTKQTGDTLSLNFEDPGIPGGSATDSYTVGSSDTLATIAQKLAEAVNFDGRLSGLGISASAFGSVLTIRMQPGNQTVVTSTVTGSSPTETITLDTAPPFISVAAPVSLGSVAVSAATSATGTPGETANVGGGGLVGGVSYALVGSTNPYPPTCYAYDALQRTTDQLLDGSANRSSWTYDNMSRVTGESNPLGSFAYAYVDASKGTTRLSSITYPNSQVTNFSYYGNSGDQRLQQISNLNPSSVMLSQFDYQYDSVGQITQWRQQQNGGDLYNNYGYDLAGQLITAQIGGASQPPYSNQYYYAYDLAANRIAEQFVNSSNIASITQAGFTKTNALNVLAPGGMARFQATTDKAAKSAKVQSTVVSVTCTSPNATTYSTTSGTNITLTAGTNMNGNVTLAVGGTNPAPANDLIKVKIFNSSLPGGNKEKSYNITSGQSLVSIAAGLASAMASDTDYQAIGVSATSTSPGQLYSALKLYPSGELQCRDPVSWQKRVQISFR